MKAVLQILSVLALTIILTTIGLVLYSQLHTPTGMGWDQIADFLGAAMISIFASLIISILAVRNRSMKTLKTMTLVTWLIVIVLYITARIMFPKSNEPAENNSPPLKPTAPAQSISLKDKVELPFFLGLLSFTDGATFLYNGGNDIPTIQDSIVVKNGNITYAPPYFYPFYMKSDYQLVRMKGKSKTRHYVQLEVNQQTGQTAWFSREEVIVESTEDYILSSASLDPIYPNDYPVRVRPFNHSDPASFNKSIEYLIPISIQKEFVEVKVLHSESEILGTGWILWKKDNELLVRTNPFW